MAQHGMVVTSQPLAAQAGLQILKQGGNAIDAAVATAAMLNVTEPMMVGIGGDMFAIVYVARERKVYVLNASGMAPTGATVERFNKLGYAWNPKNWGPGSGMPAGGILPVTVPGALWGWQAVLKRFGKLTFKEVLEPAAEYAQGGFPISERIAHDWRLPNALPLQGCCTSLDPDSVKTWYVNGAQPVSGQIFRNPDLARTLRLLQTKGAEAFYKGEIAQAIVAKSQALGGSMTLEDLANYKGEWVEPARTVYHGYDILELPPPAQAWATDEILNILRVCVPQWTTGRSLASLGPTNPEYWHFLIEAKKLAYADLYQYNADPNFAAVPLGKLLSESYAASLCAKVDPQHASTPRPSGKFFHAGRHHRAVDRRCRRQHGVLGEQQLFRFRLRRDGAGLRLHSAQSRRAIYAQSQEPQCHRAPQEAVQYLVRGLRDAQRSAADDGYVDGRRHAGAGTRAAVGQYFRSRREFAGGRGHGEIPPFPGVQ